MLAIRQAPIISSDCIINLGITFPLKEEKKKEIKYKAKNKSIGRSRCFLANTGTFLKSSRSLPQKCLRSV